MSVARNPSAHKTVSANRKFDIARIFGIPVNADLIEGCAVISSQLRNLRSGPIMDAGGVNEHTVRAWIRNNALKLGDRETREAGRPRYDLSDAARLTLMRYLTERLAMPAGPAAAVTNAAGSHLQMLAEDEMDSIDAPEASPSVTRYLMLIDRVDGLHKPEIVDLATYEEMNGVRGRILEVRIELREIVRMARDRLMGALNLSTSELRHDFDEVRKLS